MADIRLPFEFPDTPEKLQANFQALYEFITAVEAKTEAFVNIKVADGAVVKLITDSSGNALQPTNPSFQAKNGADVSFAGTVLATVAIDTEDYDLGSDFDTGTYTFTVPVTGTYILSSSGIIETQTTGNRYGVVAIVSDSLGTLNSTGQSFVAVGLSPYSIIVARQLTAGDTITLKQSFSITGTTGTGRIVSNSRLTGVLVN